MAKLEFVDAHVHFYDMQHPELVYGHWQPGVPHPTMGMKMQPLAERNYLAEDYIAETRNANVVKAVHVQAAIDSPDPVTETEWLQEAADRTGYPHGIVAHTDFRSPDAGEELDRHCESPNMRGVRMMGHDDMLDEPDFRRGVAELARRGLSFDLNGEWERADAGLRLARSFPDMWVVVTHTGLPYERTVECFRHWRKGMETFAQAPNMVVKISGLGMRDRNWTVGSIRPWILETIDIFGVDRCMFGTNWPVDRLYGGFDTLLEAYRRVIAGFSADEQAKLFAQNAERYYRI